MELSLQSPRPAPLFFEATSFSQRKKTPFKAPPKAPAKSCPPVSRVFASPRYRNGAHAISFKSDTTNDPISSPYYLTQCSQPYFEQCFDILTKVGEGSFGEVFKVRNKDDGRLYAVKRSRQRFIGELDRRKKLDEVEKHERLPPHSNCVRFYRAWEERLHLYIQTELCLMSLAEYCDLHGKIPEQRIWHVLLDVTQGVQHLHDNRLCHFDIKPANIFIAQDGYTCKLGDFGLVVSMDNGYRGALEGDACYIAPELLEGRFSPAADIFSLGISVLELACDLELPSCGCTWHALREGHLPEEFIIGLSTDLVNVLSWMMHPDPINRPTVHCLLQQRHLRTVRLLRPIITSKNKIKLVVSDIWKWFYGWLITFLVMISTVLSPRKLTKSESPLQTEPTISSFEESDDEDNSRTSLSTYHNGSWINHSPKQFHCPVYTGSPIPLDLEDSSADEATPTRYGSPLLTSSPATITKSERHLLSRRSLVGPNMLSPRNVNISPRNLMDVFNEAGD